MIYEVCYIIADCKNLSTGLYLTALFSIILIVDMEKDKFEISWTTLWRVLFMLLFVAALFLARQALIILFLAIVVSSALDGSVSYLQRKKIPRILGALFIFIGVLTILAFLLYTLIPIAIFELQNLLGNLKEMEIPVFGTMDASQFTGIDKYLQSY